MYKVPSTVRESMLSLNPYAMGTQEFQFGEAVNRHVDIFRFSST